MGSSLEVGKRLSPAVPLDAVRPVADLGVASESTAPPSWTNLRSEVNFRQNRLNEEDEHSCSNSRQDPSGW